mgnify:CR=1 FL=1
MTISIAASTSGTFEDAVNTATIVATDLVNYRLVTGATGTSMTLRVSGCMFENTDAVIATTLPPGQSQAAGSRLPLLGAGL